MGGLKLALSRAWSWGRWLLAVLAGVAVALAWAYWRGRKAGQQDSRAYLQEAVHEATTQRRRREFEAELRQLDLIADPAQRVLAKARLVQRYSDISGAAGTAGLSRPGPSGQSER